MKKVLSLLAIGTLLLWGGMFLYYYLSGRIEAYLDPAFRVYALISGIGFLLLGAFNFLNRERAADTCCAHGDEAGHSHGHHHPGCDHEHDHHHDHACDHDHHHEQACDHGHGHACEHDHHDGHACGHDHDEAVAEVAHHHHEDSPSGVLVALLILIVPLLVTTTYSKDRFSSAYLMKWGKIERQMMQMRIAKQREGVGNGAAPVTNPYTADGVAGAGGPTSADTPPDPSQAGGAKEGEAEAWGTFTMEDLKKMVPQNDKGEFLLDIPQIFYTAGDRELMEVMEGIPVEATAQLMEETLHNPDKTRLKAFRLFIECCAADARPLSIPIDFGKAPPPYTEMGWYRIYGKLHYANENEEIIPILRVERIEETSEPTDGLLF